MKVFPFVLFILFLVGVVACKKEKPIIPPPVPAPEIKVLLKDIVQTNLPSPRYHFEYDGEKKITKAAFSSGMAVYNLSYNNELVSKMENTVQANKDRIQYDYDPQKRVDLIKIVNAAGTVYRFASLSYDAANRLGKIEWEVRIDGLGFALEQTIDLAYDNKGNLATLRDERHFIAGRQPAAVYTDLYEQYDEGTNVDGFSLLHFNDRHLVLLPGIKLQQNNPRKLSRSGDGVNYNISYSYTYEKNLPLQKSGDMVITNGPDAGKHFMIGSTFSYY